MKFLFRILLGSLILYLGFFLWFNRSTFTQKFDPEFSKDRYFNSRYVKGGLGEYTLSDEELYVIEGYFLVGEKYDLHNLTPGHPPLGKYFIGLSIGLFKNPYWFNLLFGLITLWLFYQVSRLLKLSPLISLIITLFLLLESLFREQLNTSLLDIYLLAFSLTAIYFYFNWLNKPLNKYLYLSQFFLGLTLASKFFPTALPLIGALILTTVLTGKFPRFISHIISLPFIGIGFLVGHLSYFFYHFSPLEFIKYQRYIISWWAGSPQVPPLQVWDLIYANRWHTWWGREEILSTTYWWFGWPVIFTLALLSLPLIYYAKKLRPQTIALYLWLIFSLFLFSFEAIYPRHLLLILPAVYLLTAQLLYSRKQK